MRTSYARFERTSGCVIGQGTEEELVITGFKPTIPRTLLFWFATVATFGLVLLWIYWKPSCGRWRYEKCCLSDATIVSVEDSDGDVEFCPVVLVEEEQRRWDEEFSSDPPLISPPQQPSVTNHDPPLRRKSTPSVSARSRTTSEMFNGPPLRVLEDIFEEHRDQELDDRPAGAPVVRLFVFHGVRFVFNERSDEFFALSGLDDRVRCCDLTRRYYGWTERGQVFRRQIFGENIIEVKVPSYLTLFYKEALNPFYVFQICSLILWSFDDYYIYAACVLLMSFVSIIFELYETRSQLRSLRDMVSTANESIVTVRRPNGALENVPSADLTPGDILVVSSSSAVITNNSEDGFLFPCDAVLLNGSCIADESILTGESVPIVKIPPTANEAEEFFDTEKHQKHVVFCGSRIMQTHVLDGGNLLCLVVRTGFASAKGSLVRSVLYPKRIRFDFYRDSVIFLIVLVVIAVVGVGYSAAIFTSRGMEMKKVLINSLDIITIVVPPTLPAAMTVGLWYSQRRLKSKRIYSTSPHRINLCGKLNLICLDKTGTLTEEGLELNGVFPCRERANEFGDLVEDLSTLEFGPLLSCLVTCHNLATVGGKTVGESLDLGIFQSTKWVMETNVLDTFAPTVVKPSVVDATTAAGNTNNQSIDTDDMEDLVKSPPLELGILRQFPFSPDFQRCTVIARRLGHFPMAVYCKGAPEKVAALCKPETVPPDFRRLVDSETMLGRRVLALAARYLPKKTLWHHLQRMRREDIERDMEFVGIVTFRNRLKPSTSGVIRELREAKIRCVMVTGDSLLTSLCVARECGMIRNYEEVGIVSADIRGDSSSAASAETSDHHDEPINLTCKPYPDFGGNVTTFSYQNDSSMVIASGLFNAPRFAINGPDFALIRERSPPDMFKEVISRGIVFARMRPEQKAQLVEAFQDLGFIVGMCGDGANDCSALKAAHAGVSLSDLEASIAAPFTCRVQTIECIPELIKEGRCALITSFGMFKYMTMYSMIQFISVLILYSMDLFFADYMYLLIDLAIITVIALLMGRTKASNRLDRKQPSAKLLSYCSVLSIVTHVLLVAMTQMGAVFYLCSRKWYAPVNPDPNDELSFSWETTTVFFVSCYQYLIMAVIFSGGTPHRKPFYTNFPFVAALLFFTYFITVVLFVRVQFLDSLLELIPIPYGLWRFQLSLVLLASLNLVVSALAEFAFSYLDVDVRHGKALIVKPTQKLFKMHRGPN